MSVAGMCATLAFLSLTVKADDTKTQSTNAPPPPLTAELLLREVHYNGKLSDTQAKFIVDIDAELLNKGEASLTLFEGEVALLPARLPAGLRIVREAKQYRLVASKPGKYKLKLELVAKITRAEPWNQISFVGPAASIASVAAAADAAEVELQLLTGTPLEQENKEKSRVRGVLGADRNVALRWQSKAAEAARKAVVTCETVATAQITPTVIQFTTELRYDIVQGNLARFSVVLPANHALTRVEGNQIRDWQSTMDGDHQILTVELSKPVEKYYTLKLFSEQTVESTPFTAQLALPQPQEIDRESGSFTLLAQDTTVETESTSGLRQINAPAGALAAYRFYVRPLTLSVKLRRIEPVINAANRVTARLEDARLLVTHALTLNVEKAGVYSLELSPLHAFIVTDVRGDGVEDWKARDGRLSVNFSSRVLGERKLEVRLEQAQKTFPEQIEVAPLQIATATRQTAQIGAASAPGIRLKTAELVGLREISVANLANRSDELLAYVADQQDWTLKLSAEKLAPRVVADIFNLVTIGDGLVGGSATIRYVIVNQGVQEFRVKLPANWKNVDFTGPNIRRKEQVGPAPDGAAQDTNSVLWSIALQDKVWGGYTLVITYDEQFDLHKATLNVGGAHAVGVERETGGVAITSAASLQLREVKAADPLRRIDESELAETDRAMVTRSVLLAYRYEDAAKPYELAVDVSRFEELPVLSAVADRTQLTTVLTEGGEMLTQASFMVKNNDKQFQRFSLSKSAKLWSSFVNGQAVKAEQQGDTILVPLPRGANRDQAFAVEIVYAQNLGSLKSFTPREIALAAPKTDIQTTFAEWELFVPATHHLRKFGGNMSIAQGTIYGLLDAWEEFVGVYRDLLRNSQGFLVGMVVVGLLGLLVVAAVRRGLQGFATALLALAVMAILAGMMLPALSKAKSKAQRVVAVNNLKQIGLALRMRAAEKNEQLPARLDELVGKEIDSERTLVDPKTGQRFEYLGSRNNLSPDSVLAFSAGDHDNGRAVLFADGSVQQLNTDQFRDVLAKDGIAWSPNAPAQTQAGGLGRVAMFGVAGVNGAATVTSAPGTPPTAKTPMLSGIRPIRIDIPRTGARFVFTKVLNVSDEALSLQAWAVATKTWNGLRSALQVAVFLSGLLALWWQFRRKATNSFVVSLALALIFASVGGMLLATRLLGMALIVGAPLILLVLLAVLAWRIWRSRKAGEQTEPGADALQTGNGGISPVTPLIALAFFLAISANAREVESADHAPRPSSVASLRRMDITHHESFSILSATYTGTIHERIAQVEAIIQLSSSKGGETIPLFGEDVAVEQFSATPSNVKLLRQGDAVSVRLPKTGEATLKVKFLIKLAGDVTKRHLTFRIPPALSSKLSLTINEAEAAVEFPTAVSFHSASAQQQTRVEAIIGSGERVELHWTPRVKRAAEIAATVFCQNASLISFSGGVMNTRSVLEYQITQGELREARIKLPAGHRLLRVDGEHIRTWQVRQSSRSAPIQGGAAPTGATTVDTSTASSTPDAAAGRSEDSGLLSEMPALQSEGDLLAVELVKGLSPNYRLVVETEKVVEKLPDTFAVETPHALDVKRETGWVALSGSEELGLTVENLQGLQKMDAAEFLKIAAQPKPVANAYQFLKPQFALTVRVEALLPQLEATVCNRVRIGAEQIHLVANVDYAIKRAGVFALRLALPTDFRIETVTGDEIAQWIEKSEGDSRVLEVALKHRTIGNYSLQLQLVKSHKELPKTLDIAGVHPLDSEKLTGFLIVATDAGVQAKTASFEGLTEVPAASVPDGGSGLAYKFIGGAPVPAKSPWKLAVATESVESWVRAEVVNWLTVSESLVNGRALVRYDIQNAPVKEFRLRVPASFKNVEITGNNIRRRDQSGEEWRAELQSKIIGSYLLTVTWEQSWNASGAGENLLDAAGIEALGVERETGALAVMSRSQLQINPKSASPELLRIDPQELPDWAGRADANTVLAYRYLRPGYKLSLAAQRFAQAEVLQALVDDARLTTVVAEDGQMMTELALAVRNKGLQFLEITLPKGAQVWSAFVAGQAVRPSVRAGKLLLPLEKSAGDDAPLAIELTYVSSEKFPRTRGTVELASPALAVPVKSARWELYLPPDYGYRKFTGTMTHEADAAPVYRTFTLGDYSQVETGKEKARGLEVQNNLREARSKLTSGKVEEAARHYNYARRSLAADDKPVEELKKLELELNRAQSSNLLEGQKAVIANNSVFFQQAGELPIQQDRQLGGKYDEKAAELQWQKLQQAQEMATTSVKPLRVNLPARGLRHSFSQVLQTEVGKPMLVRFSASNTKVTSRPMQVGYALLAFVGLWALVNLTLRQRMAKATA